MSHYQGQHLGRWRQNLRDRLPALLLLLVALAQLGLAWGGGRLNPDKGGGFGMFSTVDRLNHRHFRAYLIGPDGEQLLHLHPGHSLRPALRRATSLPSEQHLREVAAQLIEQERHRHHLQVWAVRVEVWKSSFDPFSLQVHPLQVAALTLGEP